MCSCLLFTFNWAENVNVLYKKSRKKNDTFGYLNKEASWSCVGAEGGGCGGLSPELLGLVKEGQGGPCPQRVSPGRRAVLHPASLVRHQGSWRAAQELQEWAPSLAGTRGTSPLS